MPRRLTQAEVEQLYASQSSHELFERLIARIARAVLLPGDGAVAGGWVVAFDPQPAPAGRRSTPVLDCGRGLLTDAARDP